MTANLPGGAGTDRQVSLTGDGHEHGGAPARATQEGAAR